MVALKKYSLITCIFLFILSCKKEKLKQNPFLVSTLSIGLLTDSTQVKDLKYAFEGDSITKYIGGDEFTGDINDFEVFEKNGTLLLALTPKEDLDSTSTIKSIRIVDPRYKTVKGINANSTFKDLKDNYTISNIENTLQSLIVSVNDINAYFTLDKNELPASIRFDMNLKIKANQIPDATKIKNFFIQWF